MTLTSTRANPLRGLAEWNLWWDGMVGQKLDGAGGIGFHPCDPTRRSPQVWGAPAWRIFIENALRTSEGELSVFPISSGLVSEGGGTHFWVLDRVEIRAPVATLRPMKNVFDKAVADEWTGRIGGLTAETQPRWGAMGAAQMLAHCSVP